MATDDVLKGVLTEDELNAYHEGTCYVTPMMSMHRACIRRLAALVAEQREQQWVKCSERLPEENQIVWFYVPSRDEILSGYWNGEGFSENGGEYLDAVFELDRATHWLPYTPPTAPADQGDSTNA